jgi:membrane associated rhomboid family serine protease
MPRTSQAFTGERDPYAAHRVLVVAFGELSGDTLVTPWVKRLLFANIAVFFLQLTMPGLADAVAFVPTLALVRPWTIITYMFLHGGLMHIAFNMMALYFFGPAVEARLGAREFAMLYFVSGVSGALLSLLLAPGSPIIGASAAVFGVMLAFAFFWPDAPIYIWGVLPVPARLLVIITTELALWSGLSGSRGGIADFAHLGGYAGAFIYLRWVRKWASGPRLPSATSGSRKVKGGPEVSNWRAVDTSRVHEINRDEVNRILDKISGTGIDSLTLQERTFLSNFVPRDDRTPPVS